MLIVGLVVLGIWSHGNHAKRIEDQLMNVAKATTDNTIHPVSATVSGRDIKVSGLADSDKEKQEILSGLNSIVGRRVVVDELRVLKKAAPYRFSGKKSDENALIFSGNIPTEASRESFSNIAGSSSKLDLAAGMPDEEWPEFVTRAVHALFETKSGEFEITDRKLILKGVVENPAAEAVVRKALGALPDGYLAEIELTLLDDGKPAELSFDYNAGKGASVSGKAPAGLDISKIAKALGIAKLGGSIKESTYDGADAILAKFKSLGKWLPYFNSAKLVAGTSNVNISGELLKGSDTKLVTDSLKEALGMGANISIKPATDSGKDGSERVNTISGKSEIYSQGYWLPVVQFSPSVQSCEQGTSQILSNRSINFITGSAHLGPRSLRVINDLSAVVRHCLANTGLAVEIGGYTDSQGEDAANLELSQQRAAAVVEAMALRGVDKQAMTAQGFGEQQPIADNNTKEGRAKNRRTTFTWKQN